MRRSRSTSALGGLNSLISSAFTRISFSCGNDADDFLGLLAFDCFDSTVDMDHHQFQPVRGRQADRQPARLTRLGVVKVLLNQAIRISEDLNRRFKTQAVF